MFPSVRRPRNAHLRLFLATFTSWHAKHHFESSTKVGGVFEAYSLANFADALFGSSKQLHSLLHTLVFDVILGVDACEHLKILPYIISRNMGHGR